MRNKRKLKLTEGKQPTLQNEKAKPKLCSDCGFLTIGQGRYLNEREREYLRQSTFINRGDKSLVGLEFLAEECTVRCFLPGKWGDYRWSPHGWLMLDEFFTEMAKPRGTSCRDSVRYEARLTPMDLIKRINEARRVNKLKTTEKRRGKGHARRNPTGDETVIIDAINEGCTGIRFCHALDAKEVKPRNGWTDKSNPYPWPGSYVDAYKAKIPLHKNFWKKRIQDYKNDTQRNFTHLIHRKKRTTSSPTRHGE